MYFFQHCFFCRPSYYTVSQDAGTDPKTRATNALAVRRSNHSARTNFPMKKCDVEIFYLRIIIGCVVVRREILDHESKYHIRKEKSMFKLTPILKQTKTESR